MMEVKECRGFWWIGQAFEHCDNCGGDIREHDGLHHTPGGPFDTESVIVPFKEAMVLIPLFAHYVTPIKHKEGPYRWEKP
jgi:hypothetical protein